MQNDKRTTGPLSSLFKQAANISKAHGYDILAKQVGELKEENQALRESNTRLKEALEWIEHHALQNGCSKEILKAVAKEALTNNNPK